MTRSAGDEGALTRSSVLSSSIPPARSGLGAHPATTGTGRPGAPLPMPDVAPCDARGGGVRGMGLFDRLRGGAGRGAAAGPRRGTLDRGAGKADLTHLEQFVASRRGVEGYVEPRTAVTETTIVLVA